MSKESHVSQPERENPPEEFLSLQGRLVLKNQKYLNPNVAFAEDEPRTNTFAERNYQPFEAASKKERLASWVFSGPDATFDSRMDLWNRSIVSRLKKQDDTAWDNLYSTYFDTIDLQMDDPKNELNLDYAAKIHTRYFSDLKESNYKGVKLFVADILRTYTQDGKVSVQDIIRDIPAIKTLTGIFGNGKSPDMIVQLILAEARLQSDPTFTQKLIEKVPESNEMRLNTLYQKEHDILSFISSMNTEQTDEEPEEEFTGSGELPIMKRKEEIMHSIRNNNNTIIIGGTGSGKTVGVPPMIREIMKEMKEAGQNGKLYVTQPTQVNTSSIASRVAELEGVVLGEEIGYEHGDNDEVSSTSDTIFATERKLVKRLMKDPLLLDTSHVMIDEIHVRSTDTEELVGLLMKAQALREKLGHPSLKLIASSATVNKEELQEYFGVKAIEVQGKTYEVTPKWSSINYTDEQLPEAAAVQVAQIERDGEDGDILIFVAGTKEIQQTEDALKKLNLENTQIIPMHSTSPEEQKKEVEKTAPEGTRRVIISTNFAETGITINGLRHVINSGREYTKGIDSITGLPYMEKIDKCQDAINQSSGRVGRNAPGYVHHLYTENNFNKRPKHPIPLIQRSDITQVLMDMKVWEAKLQKKYPEAENEDLSVQFLSKLDSKRIEFAEETLQMLGAADGSGSLTAIGKSMVELPVDFHGARMIVEAERRGKGIDDMCIIASLTDNKSPISRDPALKEKTFEAFKFKAAGSDFLMYLNLWKAFEKEDENNREQWAKDYGLDYGVLMSVNKKLTKLRERFGKTKSRGASPEELQQMVTQGFKDRLMKLHADKRTYIWERKKVANFNLKVDRDSMVAKGALPAYVISASNSRPRQNDIYLNMCQAANPN